MADEPRRSVRATKGQHTKSLDLLDQPTEPTKKRYTKKAISARKAASQEETSNSGEDIIRCICGVIDQSDESNEDWIACETCSAWQHNVCMGITTDQALVEALQYWCERCKPENHEELLDGIARGEKPWEERRAAYEEAEIEAAKSKRGKKGKAKRTSDPKPEVEQNGKAKQIEPQVEIKKEKEKDRKEVVERSGSTKRKTRDEPVEDSSKNKLRKVSTSQPKAVAPPSAAPADIPATIEELEKKRAGVAKLMHKNLLFSMRNAAKNGTYRASDAEMNQKATRLALEIERATHDTHPDYSAYGGQARKIVANLKTNEEICASLLLKTLSPSSLAVMTDDDMASKELQRQTAEMKARAEKQSIMVTDDGPRIRRTHKGDEVIEEDSFPVAAEELPAARRRSILDPNAGLVTHSGENTPDDETELPPDTDNYHSQDNIRDDTTPSRPLTVDTQSSTSLPKASTKAGDFDIKRVFSSVQSPTTFQHARKPSGNIQTGEGSGEGPGEDPDIDRLLEDGNESPPYSPSAYDVDPTVVWRGALTMNTVADFPALARHVGGADLGSVGTSRVPWSDLVPQRLQVAGRIDAVKANEYLCGLRYSAPTDLVVLALTPSGDTASAEFTKLFDYFHSKTRYGVVGNKALGNVRDTYLVPVPAGTGNVPEFLLNLENNKLPENRPEPMILITLAVRHEILPSSDRTFDVPSSPNTIVNHPQRQMSMGGYSGPQMSPINPQGSFVSPITPQIHAPPAQLTAFEQQQQLQLQPEASRRQREEEQARGEALARQILGRFISAPTVSFIIPQAYQMHAREWQVIRQIYEQEPKTQDDLTFLSRLLEEKGAGNSDSNSIPTK